MNQNAIKAAEKLLRSFGTDIRIGLSVPCEAIPHTNFIAYRGENRLRTHLMGTGPTLEAAIDDLYAKEADALQVAA